MIVRKMGEDLKEKGADLSKIESEVKGKTMIVYMHFLKRGSEPIGVREVQRDLGFSSPSVAWHHLEKLKDLELLQKTAEGEYVLSKKVPVGVLRMFFRIGGFMVPRFLFYAVLFTAMLISYSIIFAKYDPAVLIFGALACLILWYESAKAMKEAPF